MSRSSISVRIGRFIQKYYRYFSFLDILFDLKKKKNDKLVICLLSPPRSGSTLTYQLLTNTIEHSSSLKNLSNLLYATPLIGNKLCQFLCKKHKSSFQSSQGFVDGICGEAEGLKFWSYWMGQGLNEDKSTLNIDKLQILKNKFDKFDADVIITGYLGHVFSVKELENIFDNIIFIHLKRDLLSNATSLLTLHNAGNFSSTPKELEDTNLDKYDYVLKQISLIHRNISTASSENIVMLKYEDICDNPRLELEKIKEKALEKGFELHINYNNTPNTLTKSVVKVNKNIDTKTLQKYIQEQKYD